MDAQIKNSDRPKILTWIGGAIISFGILFIPLGTIATIGKYFEGEEDFFSSLYGLYDFIGTAIGICGFGLAVARGKRWHLFALLLIMFFGSFLIGLFSMVGKETNIGYYIWAIGGGFSLFLLLFMYLYWDEFIDG